MTRQFNRVVEVVIGPPGATGRKIAGLRIGFNVVQTIASVADVAEITVFNPSPDTIRALDDTRNITRLMAGYGSPVQLAIGSMVKNTLTVSRDTVDQTAVWQIHDGGADLGAVFVSRAWASVVTAAAVVQSVIADAGLATGYVNVPASLQYSRGYVAFGSLRDTLDEIAADARCVWNIQSGRVNFYPRTQAKRGVSAPLLSPTSGLIGSPRKTDKGIEVVSLLDPAFRPGDPFTVKSERVNGAYVATDVTHAGDSGWSADFYTTRSGVPRV